ncbi:MAG: metallophosphoesterase [Myxococcales bacterium]|nr:metallophosphoesterase [Myxococcales bacterium]
MRTVDRSLCVVTLLGLAAIGCGSSDDGGGGGGIPKEPVRLTTDVTLLPSKAPMKPADGRKPSDPDDREAMLAEGFGDLSEGPGEPYVARMPAGKTAPAAGPNAKRISRFVHMPDLQLADDESPTRLAAFDSPGATAGAYRPEDVDMCHLINAAVQSVNELHDTDPIDFLLLGGDNADNAQTNEVDWVLALLSGSEKVECDSGKNDDPKKGARNDGKDPFKAPGLAMPWYWVTGNHDILIQGNLPVTPVKQAEATGSEAVAGTRDWSLPGGPIVKGEIVPDDARMPLLRTELMTRIAANGDGHGLGADQEKSGKAIYTFDVQGTELRFLVLDTAAETGGSEGLLRQGDIDTVIKPALDKAQADGKWVALASHHATSSLGDGTGLGGKAQADAVSEQAWLDLLGVYPNVVFSMVGHSHENRVKWITPTAGHAYWEVMTSALADFPQQIRVVEVWDQDNGWLMLRTTNVDFSVMGDPVALEGRQLAALDFVSGWTGASGPGTTDDRNVELWIEKP